MWTSHAVQNLQRTASISKLFSGAAVETEWSSAAVQLFGLFFPSVCFVCCRRAGMKCHGRLWSFELRPTRNFFDCRRHAAAVAGLVAEREVPNFSLLRVL